MSSSPQRSDADVITLPLLVARKQKIADDVYLFELVSADQRDLPAFEAGAHITVLTPNGLTRRYSLCNSPQERGRYLIAVQREAGGLGGSVSLVDGVKPGDVLPLCGPPRNDFPLHPRAGSHLLVAGGIGITPLLAMVHALQARAAAFRLVYLSRSAQSAPFLDELRSAALADRVHVHHTQGDAGRAFDLKPLLAQQATGQHLYCCGPRRLMQAVREHTRHWQAGSVHFEDFGGSVPPVPASDTAFAVRLKRSGEIVQVPGGVSILQALRRHGIHVPSSCESGTCGTCRTALLSGVADHRDYVLDDEQQDRAIMICVSRAKSAVLDLDL